MDSTALAKEPFVVFLDPPSLDERIVNQFALFSLLSGPDLALDDWLARRPGLARRILIPATLKWEIRDKLDQANITERVLFPGLDGLSRWLGLRRPGSLPARAMGAAVAPRRGLHPVRRRRQPPGGRRESLERLPLLSFPPPTGSRLPPGGRSVAVSSFGGDG